MMKNTNNTYTKSSAQIKLEEILQVLDCNNIAISQLRKLPEYSSLSIELNNALAEIIQVLANEKSIHDLINSIACSYGSQYYEDLKQYDLFYEVLSETMLGLNTVITKTSTSKNNKVDNRGKVRIDVIQQKGHLAFTANLRSYIHNNICLDLAKHHGIKLKHEETDTTTNEEGDSISKLESVNHNKNGIESSSDFSDDVCRKMVFESDNLCSTLINAVINRFSARKPVAAFVYLNIINHTYDPVRIVNDLKTKDFNMLFHSVLSQLEIEYEVDLSCYDNIIFKADEWISSLKSISGSSKEDILKKQRARIDRLTSTTRSDCQALTTFKMVKSKYVGIRGKNFSIL